MRTARASYRKSRFTAVRRAERFGLSIFSDHSISVWHDRFMPSFDFWMTCLATIVLLAVTLPGAGARGGPFLAGVDTYP